jgi:hypothetical protein
MKENEPQMNADKRGSLRLQATIAAPQGILPLLFRTDCTAARSETLSLSERTYDQRSSAFICG